MPNKQTEYQKLEAQFVKYSDLVSVRVSECDEPFVVLPQKNNKAFCAVGEYRSLTDMAQQFLQIPVRSAVKEKLDRAARRLAEEYPEYQLVVSYGFRSLEIQKKYYQEQKKKYLQNPDPYEKESIEEVLHRSIAVPSVAGHPTGGAVDVWIKDISTGESLDFGTAIFDFETKDTYALSPFISETAQKNRALLRSCMMQEGFTPYDGEWWHFSYGDREWAYYYKKSSAIYEQKSARWVKNSFGTATSKRETRDQVTDSLLRAVSGVG